jgi:glycosyltransferase involved in cell wall biosynthesis
MGRRASGLERITRELFSAEALAPLTIRRSEASRSRVAMIHHQMIMNPILAMRSRTPIWAFPGYPPSPLFSIMRDRVVYYVHDLFLLEREQDLNRAARLYMVRPFRRAINRLRYFLVNSATTHRQLSKYVAADAEIRPYRPVVNNVFRLEGREQRAVSADSSPLIVGTLGTICHALSKELGRPVELHIIGRRGWGADHSTLARMPHVRLHGFLPDDEAREVIHTFDLFLCTSHDEGLGLPLLEIQYAGLPIVVPDQEVFREVLGSAGTYIDSRRPELAAQTIVAMLCRPAWRCEAAGLATANLARWNGQATEDHRAVVDFLTTLCTRRTSRS